MGTAEAAAARTHTGWPSCQAQQTRNPEWPSSTPFAVAVPGSCCHMILAPWRTVYHYFWSWRRNGTWQKIHDGIRASVRTAAGRHPEPSGAIGYDAAKNVSGRKRHVLVDTLGLVLLVVITAANAPDRAAARILLSMLANRFRRLRVVWADGA